MGLKKKVPITDGSHGLGNEKTFMTTENLRLTEIMKGFFFLAIMYLIAHPAVLIKTCDYRKRRAYDYC